MITFLENSSPFSCTQPPTCSQSPLFLTVNQHSKELRWLVRVGNWNVFTKRGLVEKHISDIMYENPRGGPCPPLPTPTHYVFEIAAIQKRF